MLCSPTKAGTGPWRAGGGVSGGAIDLRLIFQLRQRKQGDVAGGWGVPGRGAGGAEAQGCEEP